MAILQFANLSPLTASPLIKRLNATRSRKEKAAAWLCMYRDEFKDALLKELTQRFKDPSGRFQLFSVNVIKKVTDKRAAVYLEKPKRSFDGWDQEAGEALYRDIRADVVLKKAHRLTRLLKTTALKAAWDEDDELPTLHVITPDILDADFDDPEKPTRIYLTRHPAEHVERPETKVTYDVWTRNSFRRFDYKGNPITIAGNEQSLNPYGRIPMVPLFDYLPDAQFFLQGGEDVISSQLAVNVALVNLWRAIEHQSHGQPWTKGLPASAMLQFGPDKVINLPADGELGFADPNTPIEQVLKALEFTIKEVAITNDLSSSVFEINQRVESGAAKFAESRDLLEARKDDLPLWRAYERQLFDLIKTVVNTHQPNTIPEAATVSVNFGEIASHQSETDRLKAYQARVDLGIWSPVQALMADDPDIQSEEAALAILQRVSDQNAILGRPLAGPTFPIGETDDDG